MRTLLTVATVVLVLGVASNAAAQRGGSEVEREGFLIGFSVGGGSMSCDGCDTETGAAASFQLGSMLTDRVAVMLDLAGTTANLSDEEGNSATWTNTLSTAAVQYWVSDRFWIKGGVGIGTTSLDWEIYGETDEASGSGLGLMAGAGFELVQKGKFALDLQGRFATTKHKGGHINQIAFTLGFNWY